ncbi:MAG TPA: glycosyltransferase family 4 protein [Anaerolineae bacterium]|nr:glycosyltransferase family 4 protein [Anaerolineae bacterium]
MYWLRLENRGRNLEARQLPANVTIVDWTGGRKKVGWWNYPRLLKSFKDVVKKTKPDLIHAGPIQRTALLPALAEYHPLVTMSWGFDLLQDAERNFFYRWLTRFVLDRTDVFVADCLTLQRKAQSFGFPPQRSVIFPWGVDLKLFNPHDRGFMRRQVGYEKDLLILHTRSWERRYGVDVALRGFTLALKHEPNLRLFMLGGGLKERWVKAFVEKQGLESRVHFCGFKPNNKLTQYYQAADIFLSASHIDGSSVALMEALACGCPALVSDISSNKEWITHGKQGWLFQDGDAEDLAVKIIEISKRQKVLKEYGKRARKTAEQKADWSENFQQLEYAYELAMEITEKK